MSENIVNKSNDENVERKLTVKEFCRRYDMAKTEDTKKQMLEGIIYRKYCPVLEKKIILQTMFDKTIVSSSTGVLHIDHFLSKINMVTASLILYTKLNVKKINSSETTAFDDYDLLFQRNIINDIWNIIGERELKELLNINELITNNYIEENKTADAYISKYVNSFATTIGLFANEGIQELLKYIDENNIK